jgi:hypothetical protein
MMEARRIGMVELVPLRWSGHPVGAVQDSGRGRERRYQDTRPTSSAGPSHVAFPAEHKDLESSLTLQRGQGKAEEEGSGRDLGTQAEETRLEQEQRATDR